MYIRFLISASQIILNNTEYHAGDFDANIPGVFGEPNLSSEESSREIIPLLQKLIKTIEENGPLPQWASGQASGVGIRATGGTIQMAQGNFGMDSAGGASNNQYPQLLQTQSAQSGRKSEKHNN